jgi:hypothetical protein
MYVYLSRERTLKDVSLFERNGSYLGPMLWSQFSAIFDNFRRKNWRFYQKTMLWSKFCIIVLSYVLSQKRQFFRWFFRRKYFKNHNIGPWTLSRLKFKLNSTFEHIESELCWQKYIYIVSNRHINILCQIKHSFPEEIFKLFQDHLKIVRYFALTYN